jgi:putative phosphoribosyl transferase
MFEDRRDAGQKLGEALDSYRRCDGIVLAIPRGGVEVGYYVAEHLELPLSIIVVRKLPIPANPEAGFGAVAEDGSVVFVERFRGSLPPAVIRRTIRTGLLQFRVTPIGL